jgi:hypothetical protein
LDVAKEPIYHWSTDFECEKIDKCHIDLTVNLSWFMYHLRKIYASGLHYFSLFLSLPVESDQMFLQDKLKWFEIEGYEGVSKSFRTGRLGRELQMVQLSATRWSLSLFCESV